MEIIPSILVKTKQEFDEKIKEAEQYAGWVHIDIADGIFVPNSTIDGVSELIDSGTKIKSGVHLMVQKPENHISRWLSIGIEKIIVHAEATNKLEQIINEVKESECAIGIALNPKTPVETIKNFINEVDLVHFMTVEPGFYGSKFVPEVAEKIKDFRYFYPDVPVEVDGSVNLETIGILAEAGASIFVVGSYFWDSQDKRKAIDDLKSAVNNFKT